MGAIAIREGDKSASSRRPLWMDFFTPHTWRCTGLVLNRPPGGSPGSGFYAPSGRVGRVGGWPSGCGRD